ncbi:MAG: type I-C CRISPR-associated endonuclease Cas1 [Verrucomicrobia bacterium]|nr:MAG: type I-C CRISPR-associated endonuclease Cas1 [Verrucomicrobiota bacterium]
MKRHLNTLFVTLEGAYLHKDGAAVAIRHEGQVKLRVPLHNLEGIVCLGWDTCASASLMAACAEAKVSLSFHNPHGKFLACTQSFTSGNILLRREQYRRADAEPASCAIAANMIAAKLHNSRQVLMRAARDHGDKDPHRSAVLLRASDAILQRIPYLHRVTSLDSIRGIEGDCATFYFEAFPQLITARDPQLQIKGRSRRPPLDPVNALLSFLYVILMHDCRSACESVGLDSQCGFLHRDRPGRPSLALDLMEEFRPIFADRAVLTLLNRQQITIQDFRFEESGAVLLAEDARKTVLAHWQERKQEEIHHPFLDEKISLGLLPMIQARLLARHLRGDLDAYPAYLHK